MVNAETPAQHWAQYTEQRKKNHNTEK